MRTVEATKETNEMDREYVMNPMDQIQGLVSSLYRNSKRRPFRFGFNDRHIWKSENFTGHYDNVPVQSHRGERAACKNGTLFDHEHFTWTWIPVQNALCSVGKEP